MGCGWRCCAGRVLSRGFFGVAGFPHLQPNFANAMRLRKKKIPFHDVSCYFGSMLVFEKWCFLRPMTISFW